MRYTHFFVFVLVLLVGLTSVLTAQSVATQSSGTTRGGVMLFGGLALPNGAFGKTDGSDEAGYAKQGFFGGAEIMFSLAPSIGIVVDGRYIINKLNEEELMKGVPSGATVSVGQYTNILPMAGIRLYTTGPIGLFVDAQAGYMFSKLPEFSYSYTYLGATYSGKQDSQNGKGLAYGASAGLDIGNTLVIGGSYIISKPKFDVTSGSGSSATTTTMEQQMNMIQVWAGIRF
jgi:hypothetical protein